MIIYIAGPYSHTNFEMMCLRAAQHANAAALLLKRGYHPYSPIAHWHAIASTHSLPTDAQFWHNHNKAMVAKSSILLGLKLHEWERSIGMRQELAFAKDCGVPIRMASLEDLKDITFYLTGEQ